MEKLLAEVGAVKGVFGSMLVSAQGRVLASSLTSGYDERGLHEVGALLQRTVEGLQIANPGEAVELNLHFADKLLIVKGLGRGCLIVLCDPAINLPLFNLTADVVAKMYSSNMTSDGA